MMEEDKRAFINKQQALKQTTAKTPDAYQEPRQHAPYTKLEKKKGMVHAVSEDEQQGTTLVTREPGWNVWERDPEGKTQPSRNALPTNSNSSYDQNKYCDYHKVKGHNTKECKQLHEALVTAFKNGNVNPEPPKQKSRSWSKTKDKKKKSLRKTVGESCQEDDADQSHQEDNSTSDEEKPKSRRKIFAIRSAPSVAPIVTQPKKESLRESLDQKTGQAIDSLT